MRLYNATEIDRIVSAHHEIAQGRVLIFSTFTFIAGLIIGMLI